MRAVCRRLVAVQSLTVQKTSAVEARATIKLLWARKNYNTRNGLISDVHRDLEAIVSYRRGMRLLFCFIFWRRLFVVIGPAEQRVGGIPMCASPHRVWIALRSNCCLSAPNDAISLSVIPVSLSAHILSLSRQQMPTAPHIGLCISKMYAASHPNAHVR